MKTTTMTKMLLAAAAAGDDDDAVQMSPHHPPSSIDVAGSALLCSASSGPAPAFAVQGARSLTTAKQTHLLRCSL